ncbi:hypothetical protein BN439_3105 [Erwinia amylovora Ea644]|nr:hypothetical protein BN439_3105 [Erwinia amylovora Ea644]CCP08206.1 hypothetical protein BN440_3201 [Erwinia amylovora MR1]
MNFNQSGLGGEVDNVTNTGRNHLALLSEFNL